MATSGSGGNLMFSAGISFAKTSQGTDKEINAELNRIQHLINSKQLWVKLGIDPNAKTFLRNYGRDADTIEKKMRAVAQAIQRLQKSGNYWDKSGNGMTAAAQRLTQAYHELSVLRRTSSLKANEFEKMIVKNINEEVKAQERAEKAAQRKAEAMRRAAEKQASSLQKVNGLFGVQDGYVQNLIARLATYASIGAIGAFLTKVREVTAEFELQRVSLGAIIQDQNRANALFSEIKSFALKSPVKILDLTRYTKQLAAYQIETEKLFETTKRLTDVSVGLGVDMSRLILAYGETKASNVMNAKELRQFAMMGIPMLELLSEKLSEIYGKTISTGEAFQMIKKRMVHFDVVAQIFEDLTNKGGTFYNMQEKQGNTLYGMWAKLGDAASVMYDQIGNTEWVNNAMKGSINLLRSFMLAWRDVGRGILVAATAFVVWKANSAIIAATIGKSTALKVATDNLATAHLRLNAAMKSGNVTLLFSEKLKLKAAQSSLAAARANGIWATSWLKLRAAMLRLDAAMIANWPTIAIMAVGAGLMWLSSYIEKANKLKNALNDIQQSAKIEVGKSVQNFESLANQAVKARDGSKEQRDALEELHTTYGRIIPAQDLQIEKLREMKGNYDLLTEAIRNNIAAQKMQEGMTTIVEEYTNIEKKYLDKVRYMLTKEGVSTELNGENINFKVLDTQFDRIIKNIEKLARTTTKNVNEIWKEVLQGEGFDPSVVDKFSSKFVINSAQFVQKIREEELALTNWKKTMQDVYQGLGKFAENLKQAKERIENADYTAKAGTFDFSQQQVRESVNAYSAAIRDALKDQKSKINLDDFIVIDEDSVEKLPVIDFAKLIEAIDAESTPLKEQLLKLVESVQKEWDGLVPGDPIVRTLRGKLIEITDSYKDAGITMENMRQYFWDGSTEMKKQLKQYEDSLEKLTADIYAHEKQLEKYGAATLLMWAIQGYSLDKQKAKAKALSEYIEAFKYYLDLEALKKKGSKQSDPRLQILNNIASTMEKINKEYDDLLQKEGETKALADTQRLFAEEFANLQKIADKYHFKLPAFEVPKNAKEVKQWYEAIIKEIKRLGIKDADKVLIDLGFKANKVEIDELQKQIEQKLKNLQSRIEQSKTAKEFYDKILSATGDVDIAANVTMSIYGEDGSALQAEIAQQIKEMFGSFQVDVPVDIVTPENRVDYTALQRFLDEHREEWADKDQFKALEKLASEGQKASAQQVDAWFKEIQKAKDYAQKRVDIETNLANKISDIRAKMLPKDVEETLISGMTEKAAQELDKLQYEAFKDSPMYVELFQDLEHASTTALKAMRDRLMALKGQWQNLDPRQVKELTKSIQKLDDQIIANNPFKALVTNLTALREMKSQKILDENLKTELDNLAKAEEKLANASKKYAESQVEVNNATTDVTEARKKLQDAIDAYGEDSPEVKSAREELRVRLEILDAIKESNNENMQNAKKSLEEAKEEYNAQKEITDAAEEEANTRKKIVQNIDEANKAIDEYQSIINDVLGDVREMMEALGADDIDLQFFDDIVEGLNQIVDAGQAAATAVGAFMAGDIFTGITSSISAVAGFVTGFINLFYAGRVRKANKEIEKQQKLLEQLEYTYSRLQKAQEKLFGSDYIRNYNQQLANLVAQAEAYRKQAEAEQSKGKKADNDKIQDYKNSWRDTMDEIKDMQGDLATYFAGTDITSAARDFANSWLEARWAFEDTTEAMREKIADMVQNMIVESMAARLMQNILQPIYDMIDDATADNVITAQEIAAVSAKAYGAIGQMNDAMELMLEQLQAAGLDLSQMFGDGTTDLTGISRDIATASEESINGLAQGINTQNYYISHVPTISENVAAIRILMEGGAVAQVGGDYNTLQNEHLAQLPIIAANTLATAERCERAAIACEAMQEAIERVIVAKGGNFALNARYMN